MENCHQTAYAMTVRARGTCCQVFEKASDMGRFGLHGGGSGLGPLRYQSPGESALGLTPSLILSSLCWHSRD